MNGIINVLKPPGMTSSDVVVDIRRLLGVKKVGHTGTLDPGAAGVLPVCIGKATRLFDFLAEKDKEYICEITFGTQTDTIDAYGKVIGTSDCEVTAAMLQSLLPSFVGEQEQIPPMYSAIKFNGEKLYDLARRGETADLEFKKRAIVIYAIDYLEQTGPHRFLLKIHCSKGTYIRTLCSDIAFALGSCAYMSFLLRTRSGPFALDKSLTITEVGERMKQGQLNELLVPMDEALLALPAVNLPDSYLVGLMQGNPVPRKLAADAKEGEILRLYCAGKFCGIGKVEADLLKFKTMLLER